MVFPDIAASQGPPPQAVLDKRPWWTILLVLLAATTFMRFITLDVVGGILSALMLFLASMMVAEGMIDMSRYAMAFSMLCLLCLFFDLVPMLSCINGRSEVTVEPGEQVRDGHEVRISYTTVIKTSPFFDSSQGFLYNGASVAMILSPITMLLGSYLATHAHVELQRSITPIMGDSAEDRSWFGESVVAERAAGPTLRGMQNRLLSSTTGTESDAGPAGNLLRFVGRSHRLSPS
mmetsp:Transcript_96649/g.171898  ORF Transcript_96649/g.171898 Transcript_96649/m.171898 type:complete len:234 (+) Transcript_96649:113-814(+)|eukprot:CAMPEP_0197651484 /NCGR_PEP_ID=MMETSP1338-20131121/32744_1 /TAXON_ID=43686 ORGANISM="Pelagodinium beii, Strain RCC1491" /NCGR_SAMPLE_ID=MMETSP1338 /ASSEMBLY_ACC=CAM_ASM_000754 /LENGTH=233 /DNA_ID=CAMNT_0043226129 /DNA_START=109 /DNA_END=810 /DNA_ORIENTATION=-